MPNAKGLCVVAGAGPGMGLAIARRFAREGHDVALLARNGAALEAAAAQLRESGVHAIGVAVDLADPADIARAFGEIRASLGDPGVLVYNAAKWHAIGAMAIEPGLFAADLSLSITGALACAQQVYPAMREAGRGSLLFTGGGLALSPQYGAGVASLTAGKAGLRALVIALHAELAGEGIRVGTVTIAGTVAAGTAFDPDLIAEAYWALHLDAEGPPEIVFDGKTASSAASPTPPASPTRSLPPIYDRAPVEIAAATTIAEFPIGTFLENIAINGEGALFVTSYLEGKVYLIDTSGQRSEWTAIDGTIAGIALNPDGSAVVSGWTADKQAAVFLVDPQGRNRLLVRLPGGLFPNGVVRLAADRFLVADSYKGAIWAVNAATESATVWLEHELLARASHDDPTPAVNGIKRFGESLYASNTARQLLIKVPLIAGQAGTPEVLMTDIGLDDFDFDPQGTLYGATHVYDSLVRRDSAGRVTVLAGLAQGMAGSTAVAVRAIGNDMDVFVTTNGGMSMPPEGGVQTGKVVRVRV